MHMLTYHLVIVILISLITSCDSTTNDEIDSEPTRSEILWDQWGVPHIYARSQTEKGYGFGWAQMKSHNHEILKLYALARGRGAEFFGEEYAQSDRLLHKVGIPGGAKQKLNQQPDDFKKYLQAFADGMNDYARTNPEEIDDELKEILPVKPEDLISHTQRFFLTFASMSGENTNILNMQGLPTNAFPGSNAIAIGPDFSVSGNAMILHNPHIPWNNPLMRVFEVHLNGPEINQYGITFLGMPVIIMGFNEQMSWTHTLNTVDVFDTYRLQLKEGGYLFDGSVKSFKNSRKKEISIAREDGLTDKETIHIRHAKHGPVIHSTDSSAIAIHSPVLDLPGTLHQWWEMGKAQNYKEFHSAVENLQLPLFTTIYADQDGVIYYAFTGKVPNRPYGNFSDWQQTKDGDTSATLWEGYHSLEELPTLLNPESGFVQNSNSPPWFATVPSPLDPADYPDYIAPEWLLPREQSGLKLLLTQSSLSFEDLIDIRYNNRMLLADQVLDDLLYAAQDAPDSLTQAAADVLDSWDRHAGPDSEGALLFTLWALETCQGPETNFCNFDQPWSAYDPLGTPKGLANPQSSTEILGRIARQVREHFGRLDIPWGEVMRLSDDLPGTGAPGDPLGVYHVMHYNPVESGEYRPVFGDTWVAAIEFTKDGPNAKAVMPYGNTDNPQFADNTQLELLADQKMRPIFFTRQQVDNNYIERHTYQYE